MREGLTPFLHSTVARRLLEGTTETSSLADVAAQCWHNVRQDPVGAAQLLLVKAVHVWFGTRSGRHQILLALCNVPWMFLFVAASGAALRRPTWASPLHWLLIGSVWTTWFMATASYPLFRYLCGFFPFVVIVVGAWLADRTRCAVTRRQTSLSAPHQE
jgi:hypothetical protein